MTTHELEGEILHRAGTAAEWAEHNRVLRKGEAGYIDLGLPTQVERIGVGVVQPDGSITGPTFDQLPDITFGTEPSGSIAMSLPAHRHIPSSGSPVPVALAASGGIEPIIPYSTTGTVLENEAVGVQIAAVTAYQQEYVQMVHVAKYNRTYMAIVSSGTVTMYSGVKDGPTNYTWRVEASLSIAARYISLVYDAQLDILVLATNTTSAGILLGRFTISEIDGSAAYDIAHQTTVNSDATTPITSATRVALASLNNGRYILSYAMAGGNFIRPVTAMLDGSFQIKAGAIRNPTYSAVYMTAADVVAVLAYVDSAALVCLSAKVSVTGDLVIVSDEVTYIDGEPGLGGASKIDLLWDADRRLIYALSQRDTDQAIRIGTAGVTPTGALYALGRTALYTGQTAGRIRLLKYRGQVYAGVDMGSNGIKLSRISAPTNRNAASTTAIGAYITGEAIGGGVAASNDFYTTGPDSPEDMLFVRRYVDGLYVMAYSPIQASGNVDSFLGYANISETATVGQEVPTLLSGSVVSNLVGLIPNTAYYLSPQGQLNTVGKGRKIGVAIDTTKLYLTDQ